MANQLSFFDLGVEVSKQIVNITSAFRFGSRSFKTNSEKWGVAKYNSFWTGDDDGMVQKYTDPPRIMEKNNTMRVSASYA